MWMETIPQLQPLYEYTSLSNDWNRDTYLNVDAEDADDDEIAEKKKHLGWIWSCVLKALGAKNYRLIKGVKNGDSVAALRRLSQIFSDNKEKKYTQLRETYENVKSSPLRA